MLEDIVIKFNAGLPTLRRAINRRWFEFVSSLDPGGEVRFMNYGLDLGAQALELAPELEGDRYPIQLYHRVVSSAPLAGRDLLEVGCGRGGGADYLARSFAPRQVIGLDLTSTAIAFCERNYARDNLSFVQGDAELLPFESARFDVVVNIESSHCYPDVRRFFMEAARVLRPGGLLAHADFRLRGELDAWHENLRATGLEIIEQEDLSARVLSALDLDHARRAALLSAHTPWALRPIFHEFAGTRGSRVFYGTFASGERVYRRFMLRKGAAT